MGSTPFSASCKSQSTSTTTYQQTYFRNSLSKSEFIWFLYDFVRSVFSGVAPNRKLEFRKFDESLLQLSNQKWAKLKNRRFPIRIYNQPIETFYLDNSLWSDLISEAVENSDPFLAKCRTTSNLTFRFLDNKTFREKAKPIPLLERNNSPPARSTKEPEIQNWTDKKNNVREESTDARVEAQATSINLQQWWKKKNRLISKKILIQRA